MQVQLREAFGVQVGRGQEERSREEMEVRAVLHEGTQDVIRTENDRTVR